MEKTVAIRRARRLAMGGTFLVAVSLAIQLGQPEELALGSLGTTGPVACLGAILSGWFLRPSSAFAMGAAALSVMGALAVNQSGSAYTDEMLLFAIPFSAAAAIVTGHVRRWAGKTAAALSVVLVALSCGVGMTEMPIPFAVVHLAILVSLPTIPVR